MSSISVIIPAYNEEVAISQTIYSFAQELPTAQIIVVDNNSTDSTAIVARQALDRLGKRGTLIHEPRQGKSNAVRAALHSNDAEITVLVDGDLTYSATDVHNLIRPVANGDADMSVGDRISGGDYENQNTRRFHGYGNKLVNRLINFAFQSNVHDVLSGYRVFSRSFLANYSIIHKGFELETDLTLHVLDKRIRFVEVPVSYSQRPTGSVSKLNTFSDGIRVIWLVATVLRHYKPLAFFSTLSVIFALFSVASGLPAIIDYINFKFVYHIPLSILAVAFGLLSAGSLGIGLILDSISHQNKRDFERHANPRNSIP